jgi:hypothetical protein
MTAEEKKRVVTHFNGLTDFDEINTVQSPGIARMRI